MSAQWMGYFFDEAGPRLQGSKLLLCLAIADHADATGKCYPGIPLLAKKLRLSERQTKQLLKEITMEGHVKKSVGGGRGKLSGLQLKRVQPTALFTDTETVLPAAPFTEPKQCYPASKNSEAQRQETVLPSVPTPYEPFLEPKEEPKKRKPASSKTKDPVTLKTRPDLEDRDWLIHLRDQEENRGIDVFELYDRMIAWCTKKRITPSRLRLLNWLGRERESVPVSYRPEPRGRHDVGKSDYVPEEYECATCFDTREVHQPVPPERATFTGAAEFVPCPDCNVKEVVSV